jgi:uncharacterized protein (UPF0297 family)
MSRYLLYTLLSINSYISLRACAEYYPENEYLRFKLFNAEVFCKCSFAQFRYSAKYFYEMPESGECRGQISEADAQNLALWKNYFQNKFSTADIYSALYDLQISNEGPNSKNAFIRFLFLKRNQPALEYFLMMQKCGTVNNLNGDPWERDEDHVIEKKLQLLEALKNAADNTKEPELKKRYAFLALRLSYYVGDSATSTSIYNLYFKNTNAASIIDYWALYFYCINEAPGAQRNLHVAMVFRYAPDKRMAIKDYYTKKVDVKKTLTLAASKEEKDAVYLMELLFTVGPALNSIQALLENAADEELVDFAINRELSKIEDWIGTVYFSNFSPSISSVFESNERLHLQLGRDRAYAAAFLQLLKTKLSNRYKKRLGVQIAYLELLSRQFAAALKSSDEVLRTGLLTAAQKEIAYEIKALALLSLQSSKVQTIPLFCQSVLQKAQQEEHNHFLLAMSKELEWMGQSTAAAALLAKVNTGKSYSSVCFWKAKGITRDYYADFFDNYFFYLNSCYSVEAMQTLMQDIETPAQNNFDAWLKKEIVGNRFRLYDLTGSKYLRISEFKKALEAFKQVPDSVWNNSNYYYTYYLDGNPFYTNTYNEHGRTKADTKRFTKTQIVEEIVKLMEKANDPNNKDKDYAAFLLGNCFLNMSYYGNSWMLSHYYWSIYLPEDLKLADKDYYTCARAKEYYLKAMNLSKENAFKALCLRMAGRCEKYSLRFSYDQKHEAEYDKRLEEYLFNSNRYYKLLKRNFPEHYDELISNCEAFDRYYLARKKTVTAL